MQDAAAAAAAGDLDRASASASGPSPMTAPEQEQEQEQEQEPEQAEAPPASSSFSSSSSSPPPPPLPSYEPHPKPYQKRKIDVTTKLLLAREAKATSINAVSKKYDLARENIRRWIRCETQLEELEKRALQGGEGPAYRLHGGGRKISYEAMDQELADKVFEHRANDLRVTRRMIEDWAREMKERLQVDVVVCPTWVSRFMKRHGISLTKNGTVAPTDPNAPDQQRPKRLSVSPEDKLAIMYFFESSNRDMQKTLLKFYGHIADPKIKQVKARNIYNWLHKRDEIAMRAHKERMKNEAKAKKKANISGGGSSANASAAVRSAGSDDSTVVALRQRVVGAARGLSSLQGEEGDAVKYDYDYENDDSALDDDEEEDEEEEDEDGVDDLDDETGDLNGVARSYAGYGEGGNGNIGNSNAGGESTGQQQLQHAEQQALGVVPFPLSRALSKIYIPPRPGHPPTAPKPKAKKKSGRASLESRRLSSEPLEALTPEQERQLELRKRKREIVERQAALREQKDRLLVESIRCNNVLKRIKIAEENMLARKRLKDAGISQEEIDALLPVVRISGSDDAPGVPL